MKILKNTLTILIVFCLSILILGGNVQAATASISAASKVAVGDKVSVTVTFSQKVSSADFRLNYDTSKFEYVSVSKGGYGTGTKRYTYLNYEDVEDLGSVTFSFKAKATGTGAFKISNLVLSTDTASIGRSEVSVTVEKAKPTNTKPNKKPTTNNNNNNNNKNEEEKPEEIDKSALEAVKAELALKVQSDYTEDSWKALQEAISKAEGATKNSEYDEVKDKLNIEGLVPVDFEKDELFNLLIELMGKSQKDFTEESWQELQTAIETAQTSKLKSEYDEVKDKLTINTLVEQEPEEEKNFFEDILETLKSKDPLLLVLMAGVIVLTILVLILLVLYGKAKKSDSNGARRLK
ncbi:MAG: hypothetical protein HFJ52_06780 [Clostridia bacterium]|nr:hypothetical protein [Clostridia bacterium]